MHVHPVQQSWASTAVTIGFIMIVMVLRMRRMGRIQPLKLNSLWIVPAIYLVVAALMFITLPPTGWAAIASLASLLIGAAVGWQRGKLMHIHVDPQTYALNQKASPAAMVLLIGLIGVRTLARGLVGGAGEVSPAMVTDPLVAFAFGMFSLTRLEMYLRARKLLAQARIG